MKTWQWIAILGGLAGLGIAAASGKEDDPAVKAPGAPRKAAGKEALWTAILLDPSESLRLIDYFQKVTGLLPLAEPLADKMIIRENPNLGHMKKVPIGRNAGVQVVGWAADDNIQAFKVRPVTGDSRPFVYPLEVYPDEGDLYVIVSVSDFRHVMNDEFLGRGWRPVKDGKGQSFFGKVGFSDGKKEYRSVAGTRYESPTIPPAK